MLDTQFRRFIPVEHLDRPSMEEIEPIDSMQIDEDPAGKTLSSTTYPHLACIKYPQTLEVLYKIHDGECDNHSGGRSLAQKALNVGYFWPTMRHDSTEYVKK
ncbi:hypothetical protein L3X38_017064 [Prunus dulcis]|uniref:Integrase zinc-binding domain-containing protein n=1 Tax=Prunus dulcis TaxID=3755 RepID=A0AAD4ZAD9_PRUDU|nr:hypothetical protein L3X38_017064 [Prunus dulcis]